MNLIVRGSLAEYRNTHIISIMLVLFLSIAFVDAKIIDTEKHILKIMVVVYYVKFTIPLVLCIFRSQKMISIILKRKFHCLYREIFWTAFE